MPLSFAGVEKENMIRRISGTKDVRKHLENLGFVVGRMVKAITEIHGNVIVNVKELRVAISKEMAGKINI